LATNWLEYIPFGVALVAALGLAETRLGKKVDKSTFEVYAKAITETTKDIQGRMMRLEDHFFERPLTKREAEAIVEKNIK
jgi:hypothetical protein